MALSDAAYLEEVKTARDAVLAAIAQGRATITYVIRGRTHTVEATSKLLAALRDEVAFYEGRASRSARSPFRLASLSKARGIG